MTSAEVVGPELAKQRASLLRRDLAGAGHEISHSLALELVAHQCGFADWNSLVAAADRGTARARAGEREEVHHLARPTLTVSDLRALLAAHPGDVQVFVSQPHTPDAMDASLMPTVDAQCRPSLASDGQLALILEGDWPTGRYLRPRRLTVTLSGMAIGDVESANAAIAAVRTAVDELGYRGEYGMDNVLDRGAIEWTFRAVEDTALAMVERSVRRALRRLDRGRWTIESA